MKTIPLSKNKHAIVDDADYEELSKCNWFADKHNSSYYAVRNEWVGGKQRKAYGRNKDKSPWQKRA